MINVDDIPPSVLDGIRDTIANDLDDWTAWGLTLDECEYAYLTGLNRRMGEIPLKLAKVIGPIYTQLIKTAIRQRRERPYAQARELSPLLEDPEPFMP